jgi:hypothetical protein
MLGQYQQANDLFSDLFAKNLEGTLLINVNNINHIIFKIWCLQQLDQEHEARALLVQVDQFIETIPAYNMGFTGVLHEAVKGDFKQAALAYALAIEKSQYLGFWFTENFPIFDPIKKQPEYIKAHKKLMGILKAQRDELATLEQQGETQ